MVKYASNWGGLTPENKEYMYKVYQRYVPFSGKAETLGGEIIRAINRISYKYYNDGDTVARYYSSGYNYSLACDHFLEQYVAGYKSMKDVPECQFEDVLCENFNYIAKWLKENEQLFETNVEEGCLDSTPYVPLEYDDEEDEEDWDDWNNEDYEE